MAVAHHGACALPPIDVGCAKGDDDAIGRSQEFGSGTQAGIDPLEALVCRRCGEGSMMQQAMVQIMVLD